MPATSKAQQRIFAIAEHNPKQLFKKNKGLLKMGKKKLHDFAATPTSTLPERVKVKGYQEGGVISRPSLYKNPPPNWKDAELGKLQKSMADYKAWKPQHPAVRDALDQSKWKTVTPAVRYASKTLGKTALGTAGALASDLAFPNSAGLNPKEESEAIEAKGYKGFRKGGRVKK